MEYHEQRVPTESDPPLEQQKSIAQVVDGILCFDIVGRIDDNEALRLDHEGREILDSGSVAYVLIDLSLSKVFSMGAQKRLVEFLRHEKIRRTAIFGASLLARVIATMGIAAAGRDNVKMFIEKKDALIWINADKSHFTRI